MASRIHDCNGSAYLDPIECLQKFSREIYELCSGKYRLLEKPNDVPYSTEITPTFIACYKAATGGMGLISKTVVLPRNKPTQVFASKLRPLMKKLSFFCLGLRPASSWNTMNSSICNNSNAWVNIKKSTSQDSASEGCSLSLSESSTEIQRRLPLSLILANRGSSYI